MSYRRQRTPVQITSFDIVSQYSGAVIGYAENVEEVLRRAQDYRPNPEVLFIGIDQDGHHVNTWTLTEVLNGTFEAEIATMLE